MTLLKFEIAVASADGVGESDRVWFPKWVRRYAMTCPKGLTNEHRGPRGQSTLSTRRSHTSPNGAVSL
ncbi:hypothetical protein CA85_17480 [Allorhodopirellula solitaria]|uniref:Uncharacterized protein n=1 Tax=Allorhodopirellula solitaria TaxID=2527987 RepID=A0A5C5YD32_9BACT|nr:hypothetical protein CA85_17480 [Allorhodopirellula solitaria]